MKKEFIFLIAIAILVIVLVYITINNNGSKNYNTNEYVVENLNYYEEDGYYYIVNTISNEVVRVVEDEYTAKMFLTYPDYNPNPEGD